VRARPGSLAQRIGVKRGVAVSDGYEQRVEQAYQGEVYGEALFRELSARSAHEEERAKWQVLQQLEAETKARLRPLVEALGGTAAEDPAQVERGIRYAAKLADTPWLDLMAEFRDELPRYVRWFEELEGMGRPEDLAVLRAATQHERAILAFAEAELAGVADPTACLCTLLEAPPGACRGGGEPPH